MSAARQYYDALAELADNHAGESALRDIRVKGLAGLVVSYRNSGDQETVADLFKSTGDLELERAAYSLIETFKSDGGNSQG